MHWTKGVVRLTKEAAHLERPETVCSRNVASRGSKTPPPQHTASGPSHPQYGCLHGWQRAHVRTWNRMICVRHKWKVPFCKCARRSHSDGYLVGSLRPASGRVRFDRYLARIPRLPLARVKRLIWPFRKRIFSNKLCWMNFFKQTMLNAN